MEITQNDVRQLNESLKEMTRQLAANHRQEMASATAMRELVEVNKRLANQLIKTNEFLVEILAEKGKAPTTRRF